ncbi:MAG: ATP synthase F1 subunit delta [Fusicatenibacter sp.]|nr:ATP synthase F1 subunit delta [Lachnospiraceae bacterium]MDY2938010.1 ATP synthase F1 subunit delta [Fusicatenibacter sp.]
MTETARLYGGSLYELASEEQLADTILEQMRQIRTLFRENPDYLRLLGEPSIPKGERLDLIEKAFGSQAERYLVSFIKLLCEKNLLTEYGGCCEEYTRRFNADHNIAEAVVTSAVPLSSKQAEELRAKLEKISGKTISLIQRTDPSIIAGLKVELEGVHLDGTVQGRLAGITRRLNETVV